MACFTPMKSVSVASTALSASSSEAQRASR
jgi:hypothetical protein